MNAPSSLSWAAELEPWNLMPSLPLAAGDGAAGKLSIAIALALALGAACQLIARRIRLPAIVLLLPLGVVLGPDVLGVVVPEDFGSGLQVLIGLAVAIILFEGGLSLKPSALQMGGRAVWNLSTFGALLTWSLSALLAAWLFPQLGAGFAALFGALVIVTGPTVIAPLLHAVRPRARVAAVLRGESIVIDPVGALLAVLTLEFILASGSDEVGEAFLAFGARTAVGLALGAGGGLALAALLNRFHRIAGELASYLVLTGAILIFAVSEAIFAETGVLAATVAGYLFGRRHPRGIEEVERFKVQLTLLAVSTVFILLAADVKISRMADLGWPALVLLLVSMFLVRPFVALVCTRGTGITVREALFIGYVGPRGIVAAAVSSLFAGVLAERGEGERALLLRDLVFLMIAGTVGILGPTAGWVARRLGLVEAEPGGFLIVGASRPARAVARVLQEAGRRVILLDTNPFMVEAAKEVGLSAYRADALDAGTIEQFDLDGIGHVLAMTTSEKVNRLVHTVWCQEFGHGAVRAMRSESGQTEERTVGRDPTFLLAGGLAFIDLDARLRAGWSVETAEVDEGTSAEGLSALLDDELPLFALRGNDHVVWLDGDGIDRLAAGDVLLYLGAPVLPETSLEAAETEVRAAADQPAPSDSAEPNPSRPSEEEPS